MSRVHLKQGKAEVLLAKRLWHLGFRYRLNDKRLPGSPDIAILKYNIAIFVDGEFWHGQNWEKRTTVGISFTPFCRWEPEIQRLVQRCLPCNDLTAGSHGKWCENRLKRRFFS